MSKEKTNDWQVILRQTILESGLSLKEIATQSGTDHSQLSRFVHEQRGLTFITAEKVGTFLGLELRKKVRR